ncbi:MAG: hypothetical protein GTO40_15095 [Deltaproteobacteria bacterium]|nr:hypothetical protein [Deltaproteobacteria bacterium]
MGVVIDYVLGTSETTSKNSGGSPPRARRVMEDDLIWEVGLGGLLKTSYEF